MRKFCNKSLRKLNKYNGMITIIIKDTSHKEILFQTLDHQDQIMLRRKKRSIKKGVIQIQATKKVLAEKNGKK